LWLLLEEEEMSRLEIWKMEELVDLAVALDDLCHSLLPIGLAEVFVLLRLDVLSLATHNSVTLFLDGSFISCYPPLASREPAGIDAIEVKVIVF